MALGMKVNISKFAIREEILQNTPNVSHWSLENGYKGESNQNEYPIRVFNSGRRTSLDLFLALTTKNFDHRCNGYNLGFNMILTMPGDVPKMSKNSIRIPLEEDTTISIKPKLITTSEGLRHYPPNQRQCFYQSERRLRFLKMYTQHNCEAECLANFTKIQCGCVKFSMPSMSSSHWMNCPHI